MGTSVKYTGPVVRGINNKTEIALAVTAVLMFVGVPVGTLGVAVWITAHFIHKFW